MGGIRLIDADTVTDRMEADALSHASDYVDIYSSSWGPDDDGRTVEGPGVSDALVGNAIIRCWLHLAQHYLITHLAHLLRGHNITWVTLGAVPARPRGHWGWALLCYFAFAFARAAVHGGHQERHQEWPKGQRLNLRLRCR